MTRTPFLAISVAGTFAAQASAQVWDLAADWSDTLNPNGAWSYNEGPLPITSHWASWHDTGDSGWAPSLFGVPSWVQRATRTSCDIDEGQVYTHADKGPERGNVTWTAPESGLYAVYGGTWWYFNTCPGTDHAGRRMDWRFLFNDVVVQSGNIGDGDDFSSNHPAVFGGIACIDEGDVLRLEFERTTEHSTMAVVEWRIVSPPLCRADFNVNDEVDFGDLLVLLSSWATVGDCGVADLDEDGDVDFTDLLSLLAAWGPCA